MIQPISAGARARPVGRSEQVGHAREQKIISVGTSAVGFRPAARTQSAHATRCRGCRFPRIYEHNRRQLDEWAIAWKRPRRNTEKLFATPKELETEGHVKFLLCFFCRCPIPIRHPLSPGNDQPYILALHHPGPITIEQIERSTQAIFNIGTRKLAFH
jgi:hypothetical protein